MNAKIIIDKLKGGYPMNSRFRYTFISLSFSIFLILTFAVSAYSEEYKSLEGVKSVKTIFDFRFSNPAEALIHIKLIRDTYKDKVLTSMTEKPVFAVVFMGPSVTILTKNREGLTKEEKAQLDEMDKVIEAMAKDGIRLEVCLFAAGVFGIPPDSFAKELHRVDNGWIASIGYQSKGYVLVPVF
jgi:intracellular sulfur oxidation DsrE/DsrF family protein